jgi:hypothetical protein
MALDLTALTNYVKENEAQLTTAAIFKPKTASLIEQFGNTQVGIKSSEKINIMSTDAIFQAGGSCGFNSSGTTTFTQRDLTVGKIKVMESICPKTFESKYTQKALRQGSTYDYMAYATEFSDTKVAKIGAALETAIWQGDTASVDGQLNKFNGLIKQVDSLGFGGAGDPINGNPTGITVATGITTGNVMGIVDGIFNLIPAALLDKEDIVIFAGNDTFRKYVIALRNANLYHHPVDAANMELVVPGTNVKLIGVNGLNGTNVLWCSHMTNLFIGTDLLNEEEKFELFYAKEADEMRFVVEFKYAVNVAFPDEVVYFKLV